MARNVTAIEFFSGIGGWHSACKNIMEMAQQSDIDSGLIFESLLPRGDEDVVPSVSSSSSSSAAAAAAATAGLGGGGGGGGEEKEQELYRSGITFTNTMKKCSQFQIEITQAFDINTLCNDVYHLNYGGKKPSGRSIQVHVYLWTKFHFIYFFMLTPPTFSLHYY